VVDRCVDCFRRIQVILWTCIGGTILILVLILLYIRCDNYDCKGPILFKYVLCWLYIHTILSLLRLQKILLASFFLDTV